MTNNNKNQKKNYKAPKMKVVDYKHKTILLGASEENAEEGFDATFVDE